MTHSRNKTVVSRAFRCSLRSIALAISLLLLAACSAQVSSAVHDTGDAGPAEGDGEVHADDFEIPRIDGEGVYTLPDGAPVETCAAPDRVAADCAVDVSEGAVGLCNGADDDCDGQVDEGCSCAPGATQSCFLGPPGRRGIGECADGTQRCEGAGEFGVWSTCEGGTSPSAETCDSADNDCNGCQDAIDACDCLPEPEVCDGIDQDCDGVADDGLTCAFLTTADGGGATRRGVINPIETTRCGADWYAYSTPDAASANPTPDIRQHATVVVAVQHGASCGGPNVAIIADAPSSASGGRLRAAFALESGSSAEVLISDDAGECGVDRTGALQCSWDWSDCCSDGGMIGPFADGECVTVTFTEATGVSRLVVMDGYTREVTPAFTPISRVELCFQIRAPVP